MTTRGITTAEYQFALSIFQREFPPKDQIFISDEAGLSGRPYVRPSIHGNIRMNLGPLANDTLGTLEARALFAHELTHAWQLEHYGLIWYGKEALDAQVIDPIRGEDAYAYTCDASKTLGDYGSEQQGEIVENFVLGGACERQIVERTLFSTTWKLITGSDARDVAVDSDGTRYMVNRAGLIYRSSGDDWQELSGSAGLAIAANGGHVLLVNTAGRMYTLSGGTWQQLPGSDAVDIAVEVDGTAFMVNTAGKVYRFRPALGWEQLPGSDAARISAAGGQVWMVNRVGKIYRFDGAGWSQMSGSHGRDIAVSGDGPIFLTNTEGEIYRRSGDAWVKLDGSDGVTLAANAGDLVLVNSKGRLYSLSTAAAPVGAPVTILRGGAHAGLTAKVAGKAAYRPKPSRKLER